jgi:hypothetical protein
MTPKPYGRNPLADVGTDTGYPRGGDRVHSGKGKVDDMASKHPSLWQRVVRWFRPPTDQRRHGGSAAIGGH